MTTLRPFMLLHARASVFWIGAFALITGSMVLGGMHNARDRLGLYLDATFLATLWFPAAAGWLAGSVIQEFQHTSFAHLLPGVRKRMATGYLVIGLFVSGAVAGLITGMAEASPGLASTFVIGLGAYCAAGALHDPLSAWITGINAVLVLMVVARSRDLAQLTAEHPSIAGLVAIGVGVAGMRRLFARSTFRRKPFRLTKPMLGSFSLEKTRRYEQQRRLRDRSRVAQWRADYLGGQAWSWVRAAFHERHGAVGWKAIARSIGQLWGLALLVLVYAWVDRGDLPFGIALGQSLHDALFRSPHEAPFGEKGGPYLMVAIVIAAAGITTALFNAVALGDGMLYPLSRLQRARVAFRGGLVDAGIFLFVLAPVLFLLGHATGLLVGYEPRFDFMPFFFRALMVTLILIPFGHRGRLGLQAATRRKVGNTVVGVVFGIVAFVVGVAMVVFLLPLVFESAWLELGFLVAALLVSLAIYRQMLVGYYRTADLT